MNINGKHIPVGGYIISDGEIEYNKDYKEITLKVRNTGDRPIQVGSHFHFFEVNQFLSFDRKIAFGKRLNIPATTALRFEAGDEKEVSLVAFRGKKRVVGFNGLVNGWVGNEKDHAYQPNLNLALEKATKYQFYSEQEKKEKK
ncbi:urease subunit beta [Photobacterium damselae]|uniref:urease subunit beta n=1 Tax=Photobacterium damselae TaxID=38293 RepID=UPI003D7D5C21